MPFTLRAPMPPLEDYLDHAGGGGGGIALLDILAMRATGSGPDKRLVAVVLANPEDAFGKEEIFGLADYWHYRSAEQLLFILPGYKILKPLYDPKEPKPVFDPQEFTAFLDWLSKETDIEYRSMALVLLVVGHFDRGRNQWSLDWTHVFEIELERLAKSGLIESVKALFEDLIAFARKNAKAPDDAMVALQDALQADVIEPSLTRGMASFFTFFIPQDAQEAAVAIGRAKHYFKIRDVKKYK
jgi:hypothetical protein